MLITILRLHRSTPIMRVLLNCFILTFEFFNLCKAFTMTVCTQEAASATYSFSSLKKAPCQSFDYRKLFTDQSPSHVLIIHSGKNWTNFIEAIQILSKCGINSVVIDGRANNLDLKNLCPQHQKTLVLDFESSYDFDTTNENSKIFRQCINAEYLDTQKIECHFSYIDSIKSPNLTVYARPFYNYGNNSLIKYGLSSETILKNKSLCVTTMPALASPFVRQIGTIDFNETMYQGEIIQILDRIAEDFGFKYHLVIPNDGEYGVEENGSFTGMAGMVQRKECDIIAADFSVTYSRSQVIDYSPVPFHYDAVGILVNAPQPKKILKLWDWSNPFTWPVWTSFLAIMCVVSCILYCGHRYGGDKTLAHDNFTEIENCFLYVGSAYIAQGLNIHPKSWWCTVLLSFWWLVCLLEIASYCGYLIAFLTAPPQPQLPFQTLEELIQLLETDQYKACVQKGTSFYQETQSSQSQSLLQLGRWLKKNSVFLKPTPDACIDLVLKEPNVAYLSDVSELEAYQRLYCLNYSLIILPQRFCTTMYSLAFQKGSVYTTLFSSALLNIVGQGLTSTWYKNYSQTNHTCDILDVTQIGVVHASQRSLSLYEVGGVFVVFLICIVVCFLTFVFEHYVFSKRTIVRSNIVHWRR